MRPRKGEHMAKTELIILTPIFIMLVVVAFNSIRSALNYGNAGSFVLAVCVSLLSVIGMHRCLVGVMEVVLLPYAALAIAIILMPLLLCIGRYVKSQRDRVSDGDDEEKTRETGSDRLRR